MYLLPTETTSEYRHLPGNIQLHQAKEGDQEPDLGDSNPEAKYS